MNYEQQLLTPEWKLKRKYILDRDEHRCALCGKTRHLHVHHKKYSEGNAWEVPDEWLVTLCESCHAEQHGKKYDKEAIQKKRKKQYAKRRRRKENKRIKKGLIKKPVELKAKLYQKNDTAIHRELRKTFMDFVRGLKSEQKQEVKRELDSFMEMFES